MARSGDPTVGEAEEEEEDEEEAAVAAAEGIWGTWEELLLACAVSRHGAASWDSVAMEVQARTPSAPHLLTPRHCRLRYRLLQRRFGAADSDDPAPDSVPWLDELRKLRVAELRREVARYDVSIVSLQLKVKRLKEERDRNLRPAEAGEGKADPEAADERMGGSPGSKPGSSAGDRSCKESNSTNPKARQLAVEDGGMPDGEAKRASAAGDTNRAAGVRRRAVGEGSYNGSSDTIAMGGVPAAEAASSPAEPDPARPGEVGESGESVAESKGRGADPEGEKESSEVQSSASLTRRRRGRRGRVGASGSVRGVGEEADAEEVSKRISSTESQPLASFLEIVRSHKYALVFDCRLESQESLRYRSTIRQHVDLETVRAKVERGAYTCAAEFFRDLLLLCTNAIVFYPKDSTESIAAVHLRDLISKEISTTIPRRAPPPPAPKEPALPLPAPPQRPSALPKLKAESDLASSLPGSSSGPLIICRKRSSISAKPPATKAEAEEKKADPEVKDSDPEEAKNRTKERSSFFGPRSLRTSKNRSGSTGGGAPAKSPNLAPPLKLSPEPDEPPARSEKKTTSSSVGVPLSKKRSAASFLSRMKRGSPDSNRPLLETLKGSSGGRAVEQKKAGKVEGKRQAAKKGAEASPPVKRSVGRPPKRTVQSPVKRAREEPEKAAAGRKRGRR